MKWLVLTLALVAAGCSDAANTQYLPIGSHCGSDGQCGTSPYDCAVTGYPGGYCEKSCALDGDCPGDSLCSPGLHKCRRVCTSDTDCRVADGYRCQPVIGGRNVCEATPPMDGGQP